MPTPTGPSATLAITSNGPIMDTTYTPGSFKLTNTSTDGQQLTTVKIDVSTAAIGGMIYDPAGGAGDTTAKAFTIDSQSGAFSVVSAVFSQGSDSIGYGVLTLQLSGFDPGENLGFSVDVDPSSIRGANSPGPGESGSISGIELTGSQITFGFTHDTLVGEIFKETTSPGGGVVHVEPGLASEPVIAVEGVAGSQASVSAAAQIVDVSGPAGGTVRVLVLEGAAYTQGVPAGAPQLGPYQANSAVGETTYDVTLDSQGHGQAHITLTHSVAEGGLNVITSAVIGPDGVIGPASAPITLAYGVQPPAPITPYFAQTTISGLPEGNYTSLQFGPDGRLYLATVDGKILAVDVEKTATGFDVGPKGIETIDSIQHIANHNDDGSLASAGYQASRQVTGILVTADPHTGAVELYVSSSDPRIGAGPTGGDSGLDTNSGVVSRLTEQADGSWSRVDLVRGLPRSEENHSVNGMQLSADGQTLYLAVGGNTNEGAPSNNFAYTPEYAYSAAILSVDLAAIGAMPTKVDASGASFVYDLPTLPPAPGDPYPNDPFGGNDGLSQAVITAGSPVQIYSPGYRNAYDLVVTQNGHMYAVDNGGNAGWGAPPGDQGPDVTNSPVDGGADFPDQLFLVTPGFYAGHPDPIRADPMGAGIYLNGATTPSANPPQGWPPVPTANPQEGVFHGPADSGSLFSGFKASTNGIAEYTASTFGGAMKGDLLTVSWDDQLYRMHLTADGLGVASVTQLTAGAGLQGNGLPLDVTTQGDGQVFAGDIFVANYGGGVTVLMPTDHAPAPPSPGATQDSDGDGLADNRDPFALDAANGLGTGLSAGETLVWAFSQNIHSPGPSGLFNMGFTGLMANGVDSYASLFDASNIKPGGAAAGFQIEQTPAGDASVSNGQLNGFQFGVSLQPDVTRFTIETKLDNPFGGDPSTAPLDFKSQGFFIGAGDQDNYLKIVASANGGAGGIEVDSETAGVLARHVYPAAIVGSQIQTLDNISLRLNVDAVAGDVTPSWTYTVGGEVFSGSGAVVHLSGSTLAALQGHYSIGNVASGLAVGIISTSQGSGETFPAFWQSISIAADPVTAVAPHGLAVFQTGGGTAVTEGGATDTVSLALTSQPTADVTVNVAGDADVGGGPAGPTFTPANWNVAQAVTVTALDDTLVEGPETAHLTFTTTSADAQFDQLSVAPLAVSVTDNDVAPPPPPPPGSGATLTASHTPDTLTGGSGDDTLNASQGPDRLTGGDGHDAFVFKLEPWAPAHIKDFVVGTDHLDISALFQKAGYTGSDPVADGYVKLLSDGAGGTEVFFDPDGPNPAHQWPDNIIDIENVPAGSATWAQISGGSAVSPPPPASPPPVSPPPVSPPPVSPPPPGGGAVIGASRTPDTLTGGSGDDTLNASQGPDQLTGGAGHDAFVFSLEPWAPAHIKDFVVGTDRLDISALFQKAGYTGSDPVADGYVKLLSDGAGGTEVFFDPDGPNPAHQWPDNIIDIDNVPVGTATWAQIAGTATGSPPTSPPPPPPVSPPPVSPPPPSGSGAVISASHTPDTLTGGSGDDTLNASQGPDQLTGGAGHDAFVFNLEPWAPAHIKDFVVGTDRLDISALFQKSGYAGPDPVADGYIKLFDDGHGGTEVFFDPDGPSLAHQWADNIIDVENVPLGTATWAQIAGGSGTTSPPPPASPPPVSPPPASPPPVSPPPVSPPPPSSSGAILQGQDGGSNLTGGSGADTLIGSGSGSDTMTGAAGADHFVFGTVPWQGAHITDFTHGVDKIDVSVLLSSVGYTGTDPVADGYIRYGDDGQGNTYVYFDRDGHGSADQWGTRVATLDHVSAGALTPGDWIVH